MTVSVYVHVHVSMHGLVIITNFYIGSGVILQKLKG